MNTKFNIAPEVRSMTREEWDELTVLESPLKRANICRYINTFGQTNESCDLVDSDGKICGSSVSTNIFNEPRKEDNPA